MSIFFKTERPNLHHYNVQFGMLGGHTCEMKYICCWGIDICGKHGLVPSDVQNCGSNGAVISEAWMVFVDFTMQLTYKSVA